MKKNRLTKKLTKSRPLAPALRFSPTAWAKLVYLRDRGDTEVGGFGASAAADPFLIEDFQLVEQSCTSVTVRFNDLAVADYFDNQVDRGLQPAEFGRLWIHTHPGDSAQPSWTDEETFARVFGSTDWAVMFILARGGQTYARLRFNVGPGAALVVPVAVDYSEPFAGSDFAAWDQEYQACVRQAEILVQRTLTALPASGFEPSVPIEAASWLAPGDDWMLDQYPHFNEEQSFYDR